MAVSENATSAGANGHAAVDSSNFAVADERVEAMVVSLLERGIDRAGIIAALSRSLLALTPGR